MGLMGALTGGVTGFLTGGPTGAAIGAAGGLLRGGKDARTTTGSQSGSSRSSSTSTQQTNLRDLTEDESRLYDQNMQYLLQNGQMTPEERQALQEKISGDIYGVGAQNIGQTYDTLSARSRASAAQRGVSGSSRTQDQALLRDASQARELGQLGVSADMAGRDAALQEEANRRAQTEMIMAQLDNTWRSRLYGSSVTTTGKTSSKTTGNTSSVAPDTTIPDAFGQMGSALRDSDSYWNTKGKDQVKGWFS